MNILKNVKGITLVALAITIVVLLILAGITFVIMNDLIIDKAVTASTKTTESLLQEQIELEWMNCEASWIEEKPNKSKNDYFIDMLKEKLESTENFDNITITGNIEETITVIFNYKNKEYTFLISNRKVSLLHLLKGNVKVGDYVEYPIEYDDIYSSEHYTATTGWRVIDDGIMPGTSGTVRLVSTGIPAKWYYDPSIYETNTKAIEDLNNHFENTDFILVNEENIKGTQFKDPAIANKITAMSLSDLNYAYNSIYNSNRDANDTNILENRNDLFYINDPQAYYWLATSKMDDTTNIYFVNTNQIVYFSNMQAGIRPVIYLNESQTGILNSNVWKIN